MEVEEEEGELEMMRHHHSNGTTIDLDLVVTAHTADLAPPGRQQWRWQTKDSQEVVLLEQEMMMMMMMMQQQKIKKKKQQQGDVVEKGEDLGPSAKERAKTHRQVCWHC